MTIDFKSQGQYDKYKDQMKSKLKGVLNYGPLKFVCESCPSLAYQLVSILIHMCIEHNTPSHNVPDAN